MQPIVLISPAINIYVRPVENLLPVSLDSLSPVPLDAEGPIHHLFGPALESVSGTAQGSHRARPSGFHLGCLGRAARRARLQWFTSSHRKAGLMDKGVPRCLIPVGLCSEQALYCVSARSPEGCRCWWLSWCLTDEKHATQSALSTGNMENGQCHRNRAT